MFSSSNKNEFAYINKLKIPNKTIIEFDEENSNKKYGEL
jgi:hypothetical protein